MKFISCLYLFLFMALPVAAESQRIELPMARFATGDDPHWKAPDFDDRDWKALNTSQYYEQQGFPGYDGYSWYRIHVTLPSAFKRSSQWQERLNVFLSAIDDADETYFNGVLIGKTGRMPQDPGGYSGQWQALRNYHVDLHTPVVRWDQDNVIAIRVYDGTGGGGFYKGVPFLKMAEKVEGLALDAGLIAAQFQGAKKVLTTLSVSNRYPVAQSGTLAHEVRDLTSGKILHRAQQPLALAAAASSQLRFTVPARPGIAVRYRYIDADSASEVQTEQLVPYLLTPPDATTPALHGTRVLGARPGSPILIRIAATGRAPMRLGARALPPGLQLDAQAGVISGSIAARGTYKLELWARNALGSARRDLTIVVGDQLALTPPMGWNSWTAYGVDVSDTLVRQAAENLISSGLAAHGWNHINLDDGWEAAQRQPNGEITGNARFPDMRALGDFLHARGLKFGIYSSPGALTCGRYLGSLGHEQQDALTYARWGVDYLKYDLCTYADTMSPTPTLAEHQKPYQLMGEILRALPRDVNYSLCQYGMQDVWKWGADVRANSWRTTWDVEDHWESILKNGFTQSALAPHAGPGHWNDPDTLVVGKLGWGNGLHPARLTPDEQYSHVSLWSLLAAPLLIGNDLSELDAFTRNLLTNTEVIDINQDALGQAGQRVLEHDGWQVWVKRLSGGRRAVGVFNMGSEYRRFQLLPGMLDMTRFAKVRDAWRQRNLGQVASGLTVATPAHGVALFVLE
jgi:hypothetical protein